MHAAGPTQRLPGDGAVWFCVLGDLIIFGAYFATYMLFRAREEQAFTESSSHLNLDIGFFNTLVLLSSSWLVARGVLSARQRDERRAARFVIGGAACGTVFIIVKLYEWWVETGHGYTFTKDTFFSFYYVLTGAHLIHVVIGLVVLSVVVLQLRSGAPARVSVAEQGAVFWHMVDLLWVFIFALLYIMR
ncbi:MAG: cytochrome c oxidase subunit 3 [Mycolicibacterium neoaurum]